MASDEQLQNLLEQAIAETLSRWVRSQKQVRHIETSMEQVWKKCKEAAEPVLGPTPDEPSSHLEDELATLCT